MPIVVKIATPEHKIKPTLIARSTWLRARYSWLIFFFAQTRPNNAAQTTTANLAKEPIV